MLVVMELVNFVFQYEGDGQQQIDLFCLIEVVIVGVVFLVVGLIIISGCNVCGIIIGVLMWLCGGIGLCCGMGDL